jgi:hypothetical protein
MYATQVNIERQLAARSETWQADGNAAPEVQDVQRLSLEEGHPPEKEAAASEGDNATKAAVEVAASAAAGAGGGRLAVSRPQGQCAGALVT